MTETRKWFLNVCICPLHTAFIIMEDSRNRFCHMFCPEQTGSSGDVGYKTTVQSAVLLTVSVNTFDMNSFIFPYFSLTISVNISCTIRMPFLCITNPAGFPAGLFFVLQKLVSVIVIKFYGRVIFSLCSFRYQPFNPYFLSVNERFHFFFRQHPSAYLSEGEPA